MSSDPRSYIIIPAWSKPDERVRPTPCRREVLEVIGEHVEDCRSCPSQYYIASEIGVSLRTVIRAINWLEDAGWLIRCSPAEFEEHTA